MPKVAAPTLPLSGLIAFHKPSGPTSNAVLDSLKHLFADSPLFADQDRKGEAVGKMRPGKGSGGKGKGRGSAPGGIKMGQGGTLDPLADGILVVGVNRGTKQLSRFLNCSKEYRTTAILGCSTDSYDALGSIDSTARWEHVTPELIEGVLARFRGEIMQMPPIYSAIRMDGKRLYEYARDGLPLPRPVEARKCTVHELVLESFQPSRAVDPEKGHAFEWPGKWLSEEERKEAKRTRQLVDEAAAKEAAGASLTTDAAAPAPPVSGPAEDAQELDQAPPRITPPTFTLRMTVSSGTYVRSIVHDVAQAVSSLATVVVLTRTRQGEFSSDAGNVVPWESVRAAADEQERLYQERKPALLAEKSRKRQELAEKQRAAAKAEREKKKGALAVENEEEAMNDVTGEGASSAPVPVVEAKEEPATQIGLKIKEPAPEKLLSPPPVPPIEEKKKRGMDELYDWEQEILAKFEEHL